MKPPDMKPPDMRSPDMRSPDMRSPDMRSMAKQVSDGNKRRGKKSAVAAKYRKYRGQSKNPSKWAALSYISWVFTLTPSIPSIWPKLAETPGRKSALVCMLLLSACIDHAGAQEDKSGENAFTPRRPASEQPALGPADVSCPRCNREEQLVVDLVYYKQVLDILEEINQQRERIDAGLLNSAHAELIKLRPDLEGLLKARNEPPVRPVVPAKNPKQPVRKQVLPDNKPAPKRGKQGIEGLVVGHVNDENSELGIKSSVVLISNGRPRSLNIGSIIEHNRRRFKIVKVDYVEDRGKGNRHEVHLEDQTSKQVHVVPWQ